jgi:alpha-beta hydrolase superfamily lysophospholipase
MFLALFLFTPPVWAGAPVNGDWVGGFERPENRVSVQTHFGEARNGTNGTIDVIDLATHARFIGKPLEKLELSRSHTHFELTISGIRLSFDGIVTNDVMAGVVEENGKRFPFRLDLMAETHASRYAGIYQVGPGHFIALATNFGSLFSFDSKSGQMSRLLPRAETDFVCGKGAKIFPMQATIHFATNRLGKVTAMRWKGQDDPALAGTPIKLPEEDVLFTNGETKLSGTLVLPATKGPHPAVVLIHGSGPGVRSTYRVFADFFAMNGIATLIYDKRGCGTSTGDWCIAGFDDLAGDALAGLEMLKNRPDINGHQIGLWGGSQGGWLVGLAAARSTNVAFIISISGPGITPDAQSAFSIERRIKAAGFSEAELREALSLYQLNSHCAQTGNGWEVFDAARKTAQNKRWYNDDLDAYAPSTQRQWQLIWNYDPVPVLHKVHCAALAIFGELDQLVPAQKSANIWKTALAEAGNRDVVIKIFPHADHGIADTRDGIPLADYFALERDWLLQHVTASY